MDWSTYSKLASITDDVSYAEQEMRNAVMTRELHYITGLVTEAGELADAYKKHVYYGKPLDEQNIKEELGDVLWYLSRYITERGLSFSEIMQANIRKLKARYPEGFDTVKALDRNIAVELEALDNA